MQILSLLTNVREIKHAVVSDLAGTLLESMGESDAETIGAVMGYTAAAINDVGAALGLGELQRISYAGKAQSCVVTMLDENVVATFIDPSTSMAAVEKKIDGALRR
ncbi:MAG: roadblock/LC7 domain-containing protein [Deltaproteobacteria bacterium]|nr:roadblock/LC7 domain-containing protein [Deltaproteobacteria bacterium]